MFKFKGISSKEMDVHVTEIDNLIRKAPQRYEEIYIDGRDGAFFHPLGYSPIEVPLELTLMKPERIDEVLQWLNGTGWLEYNGRKTKAHIFSEVEPIRASTVRIIQVTIIRNPFWEKVEDDWEEAWGANLIKNGWDDFEAYGSGKNYVENWNFENDDLSQTFSDKAKRSIVNGVFRVDFEREGGYFQFQHTGELSEKLLVRFKARGDGSFRARSWTAVEKSPWDYFHTSDEWAIYEFEVNYIGGETLRTRIYNEGDDYADYMEIDWIQITPIDNQHLVVEKNPLGNGLTRIQTWGGDSVYKLEWKGDTFSETETFTGSVYVKNLSDKSMRVFIDGFETDWIREEEEHYVVRTKTGSGRKGSFRFRSTSTGNLDFIASDPVIVEGDRVPNWQATSDPAIYNKGTAVSKPLIKLEKGKDRQCEFKVNGTYFKFHFNDDDHVILDCEEMEATYNGFNRNRHLTIGFEWPKLKPKENFVKRISGDAKILFKRKDRWL